MIATRTPRRQLPAPGMHQRFRDRRRQVREADRLRRRRHVAVAAAVLGVLGGLGALAVSPWLAVAAVAVGGVDGARAEEVQAVSAPAVGGPLVTADLPALERRVEALPWVASATARRSPPSTLSLQVLARVPAAVLQLDGIGWPVDPTGVVLPGPLDTRLPRIDARHLEEVQPGTPVDDPGVRAALDVLASLPADVAALVREVRAADPGDLRATLERGGLGIAVRLGDAESLEAKGVAVSLLLEELGDGAGGAELDVRAPTHPVVRPDPA